MGKGRITDAERGKEPISQTVGIEQMDIALGGHLPIEHLGEAKEKQGPQSKTVVERKKDTRASWCFAGPENT